MTAEEPPAEQSISSFVDALTAYAIDTTRWPELLEQLDRLSDRLASWDPGELVAEFSRAESLSWRIKQDGSQQTGFAFLLLDDQDRVVNSSEHVRALSDYLSTDAAGRIIFATPDSKTSVDLARDRLNASRRGHSLVSLSMPDGPRQRFGFLIARSEFPPSLERIAEDATLALFIAADDAGDRLQSVVQASFGLTAAEVEITMQIAQGLTLKEAGRELNITVNTARNHLQSVFDKSGINRQSDLVLAVTQLSVILAGTDSEAGTDSRRLRRQSSRHFIILPDGRRMAYRTYGEPSGAALLYLHETLGCSSLPQETAQLAAQENLFIIAPERPGFGFSDIDPGFSFESVCQDLIYLLDHLNIGHATLLGFLSGAAYALALTSAAPERVRHLILVAGRPPRRMTGRFKHLMPIYTKMISQPWLMSSFFNILRNRASPDTNAKLIKSIYGSVPYDRRYLSRQPDMLEHMIGYTLESMTVTASGIAAELKCFAKAADVALGALKLPITAWHGREDNLADLSDLKSYLAHQQVRWQIFEEAGSLVLFEHWAEILADAGSMAATGGDPSGTETNRAGNQARRIPGLPPAND